MPQNPVWSKEGKEIFDFSQKHKTPKNSFYLPTFPSSRQHIFFVPLRVSDKNFLSLFQKLFLGLSKFYFHHS